MRKSKIGEGKKRPFLGIHKKKALLTLFILFFIGIGVVTAQTQVRGTIVDEYGDPVIGATVQIRGTTQGTATDFDGNFTISAPAGGTLVVSYVGYITQEVPVSANVQVQLVPDSEMLEEVVVTALGIRRERRALGYSVASVSAAELTRAGTPVNPLSALQGRAAGLQVSGTSGGPTGGMVLRVRNAISLTENSNTRPLIVVDGMPIKDSNTDSNQRSLAGGGDRGTGINDINADDIASIEILKGAKAAVLYGAEGANGVLLITTKSGSGGRRGLGIDVNTNLAMITPAYGPQFQNQFGTGNSPGMGAYDNLSSDGFFMRRNTAGQMVESAWLGTSSSFGPRLDGRQLLSWDGTDRPYRAYENNLNDMYRTGSTGSVNVALSNGGDLGSFRLSYNYRDFQSITPNASNNTHSFSFNGNLRANDHIMVRLSSQFSQNRDLNAPFRIQDITTYGIPRDLNVREVSKSYLSDTGHNYFAAPGVRDAFPAGYIADYFWNQEQNVNDFQRNHFIQSLGIDINFNDNLSLNTLGGMDYTVTENEIKARFARPITENPLQGYYGLRSTRGAIYYAHSNFTMNYDLSDRWNFSGFVGGAVRRNTAEMQHIYIREQFAVENYFSFTNTNNPEGPSAGRERGKDLLLSLYASAQFAFAHQLYIEMQGRNDWSSILPPENNSYFYPGVSVSWIVSETFRDELPNAIQFAKLRASWADVGRPGPRYYGNMSFRLGSYGGSPTLSMPNFLPPANFSPDGTGFPKPNLKPERKREYEFGFETSFFPQNRISIDFSYFTSDTYNQIVTLPVPASSGVNSVRMNAGNIGQQGMELAINTKPIITRDFSWSLGVNFANYTTKIKELGKGIEEQILWGGTGTQITAPVGGRYGEIWVRPYARHENGERLINPQGVWYLDNTKWKKVGKVTPDILGGVNTTLQYKRFSLNTTLDFQFGATMISQTNMYLLGNGTGSRSLQFRDEANGGLPYYMNKAGERILLNSHSAAVPADSHYPFIMHDGIIVPGVNADGSTNANVIPAQRYYQSTFWQSGMALSEDMIYKSDYISLRNIALSYDLPTALVNRAKIQNARLTLFAQNLAYIYKAVPNTTPESRVGTNSFTELNIAPATRTLGVALNFSF